MQVWGTIPLWSVGPRSLLLRKLGRVFRVFLAFHLSKQIWTLWTLEIFTITLARVHASPQKWLLKWCVQSNPMQCKAMHIFWGFVCQAMIALSIYIQLAERQRLQLCLLQDCVLSYSLFKFTDVLARTLFVPFNVWDFIWKSFLIKVNLYINILVSSTRGRWFWKYFWAFVPYYSCGTCTLNLSNGPSLKNWELFRCQLLCR